MAVSRAKRQVFSSIRAQIMILTVGAVVVIMLIATVMGIVAIRSVGRTSSREMLYLLCKSGEKNLDYYFEGVEKSVEMVSAYVESDLDGLDDKQLQAHLDRVSEIFGKLTHQNDGILTYYYRIDPNVSKDVKGFWFVKEGDGQFGEHEVTDITQYDTEDTSKLVWFTVPKDTGESIWLPPYTTENLGARVISYNVPVYYRGTFVGVIGIEIDYRMMAEQVDSLTLQDDGYAFVSDAEGNLVYHPRMDDKTVASDDRQVPIELMGNERYVTYTYDGVRKQAVWLPLSNGMRLNVCVPTSWIDASWVRWGLSIIAVFAVALVICAVVVLRFANRITQPLQELTDAALQVESGNYNIALTYDAPNEVGVLTRVFSRLVAHMEQYIRNLNDLAYADVLTSVRNRGAFDIYMQNLQAKVYEGKAEPFALCLFDCNDLREINDRYGRNRGDTYIKTACALICDVFAHSPVFRVGGDEFAVVLQDADFANRGALLREFEKRARKINGTAIDRWERVDVAWGMVMYDANEDKSVEDTVQRASRLMYEHKSEQKSGKA